MREKRKLAEIHNSKACPHPRATDRACAEEKIYRAISTRPVSSMPRGHDTKHERVEPCRHCPAQVPPLVRT